MKNKTKAGAAKPKSAARATVGRPAKVVFKSSVTGRFVMSPPRSGQIPKETIVMAVAQVKTASKKRG